MNYSYSAIEQRIQAACKVARTRKNAKSAPLAREFDVSVYRLRARFHGRQSRTQSPITTKRLYESQEAALISWIDTLDALHLSPTARMVEASANATIQRDAEATKDIRWPLLISHLAVPVSLRAVEYCRLYLPSTYYAYRSASRW